MKKTVKKSELRKLIKEAISLYEAQPIHTDDETEEIEHATQKLAKFGFVKNLRMNEWTMKKNGIMVVISRDYNSFQNWHCSVSITLQLNDNISISVYGNSLEDAIINAQNVIRVVDADFAKATRAFLAI